MHAITVIPGKPEAIRVDEIERPAAGDGKLLVEGRLLGVCGTDADIVEQGYGKPPPGKERLVIGHESLGEVREAPKDSGFSEGDLVVGIVRRPDPIPCGPCSVGEWDFCRNGKYTERGIKALDGFGSRWWTIEPEYAVRLDPSVGDCGVLLEPTSVVAKAWEQTDRIFARASWRPKVALVTGAGPIGLLAAMIGVQRGLEVHVLDHNERGPKRGLVEGLGATFHVGGVEDLRFAPDVVMECTGYGPLVFDIPTVVSPNTVICLLGLNSSSRKAEVDLNGLNERLVLKNAVIFGSVNASRRNFEQAAEALAKAEVGWLKRLITRRVPMSEFADALHKREGDVKVVVDLRA